MRTALPSAALPILALSLLAACSGADDSAGVAPPTPTPTPGSAAPSFTSPATASIVENLTAAYQAAATDADGDPITFSITGGTDSGKFTITPAGALSFKTAPDFDAPGDANSDNVYLVQLGASDGTHTAMLDLQVSVTNSREGIAVRRVGTGFTQPLYVAGIPGDSRVYVVEKTGNIYRLDPASGVKTLMLTVTDLATDGERGLLGLALRDNSGEVFVHATATDGSVQIRRYNLGAGVNAPATVLLSTPHASANNHNGGWIAFGPDGLLYDAVGDGGGQGDPADNAQNPNVRLGKLLRLSVDAGSAGPAPGNPFASGGGDPYVFALGLRNPFRNSFAPDGALLIADVGQDAVEEIDLLKTIQPGTNFGWPWLEGTQPFRTGTPPAGLTAPVSQYMHGAGSRQGDTIIGGYVYRGPVTSLRGQYVFADFINGNIWTLPYASLMQGSLYPSGGYAVRNEDFAPDVGAIDQIVSFGEDSAGNLYVLDLAGEVFEVIPG